MNSKIFRKHSPSPTINDLLQRRVPVESDEGCERLAFFVILLFPSFTWEHLVFEALLQSYTRQGHNLNFLVHS